MKALQLKISLLKKKKRIYRILHVSKKETLENLHEMIQIIFNLDGCEMYTFEINKKMISRDSQDSQLKTLYRMKEKDIFYYHYDLIDSLHFKIEVLESIETEILPYCSKTSGKHLYEGVETEIDPNYQGNVDLHWINESLSYFQEEKRDNFIHEIRHEVQRLSQIRYFQDYMHNQIVKIECPQKKTIYMGCDATSDVVLNYHMNSNKLIEYTGINQNSCSQSIIKYHDCIECTLIKRSKFDEPSDFDFLVGNYGVFLSYANVISTEQIPTMYMNQYLYALRQYVNVMEYCQQNQIKYKQGFMMEMTIDHEIKQVIGRMNVYNIEFLGEEICQELVKDYSYADTSVEIDVLTFPHGEHKLETKVIVGDGQDFLETEIFNVSIKTMLVEILVLLQQRWMKYGIDKKWIFRDIHLVNEFNKIADYLGIEIVYQNNLPSIDEKYLSSNMNVEMDDLDPTQIIFKIMEELGLDPKNLQQVEISKEEVLEKIQAIKNSKKYS